jgi:hypothetical protein
MFHERSGKKFPRPVCAPQGGVVFFWGDSSRRPLRERGKFCERRGKLKKVTEYLFIFTP